MRRNSVITIIGLVALLSGQSSNDKNDPKPDNSTEAQLKAAVRDYKSWPRVSDHAHWAPTDCRMPSPEGAQASDSRDDSTHGRKLYYLFAKHAANYERLWESKPEKASAPIGQVLVKESFTSVPTLVPQRLTATQPSDREYPENYAFYRGHWFKTGEFSGLFLMLRLDATPDTDGGWIYATTDATGKITDSGRIESCMKCHAEAKYDRQFGLPYARELPATTRPANP